MRFLKGSKLFNGKKFLPENTVLVLENNGVLKDIISDSETDILNIEKLNGIITPGFINAHCHLELSHLKSVIPTKTGIAEFAKQIIINRNKISKEEISEHQQQANKQMWEAGIVAVGDICNTNDSFKIKEQSTIFYHSFIELLGLNPINAQTNFNKGLDLLNELKYNGLIGSLAPHAPYSTSNKLIHLISEFNSQNTNVNTIHNQESEEETKFFIGEKNEFEKLYAFLNIDITWFKAPNTSSFKNFYPSLKNHNTILVHNTVTKKDDIEETNNSTTFWCFCPNANLYIENKLPRFELFSELKNTICIGTDSLASNTQLDLILEANLLLKNSAVFNLETILKCITKNGAKALSIQDKFGSFILGKNTGFNLIEDASPDSYRDSSATKNNQLKFIKKIA